MWPARTARCDLWPRLKGGQEGNEDPWEWGWEAECLGTGASWVGAVWLRVGQIPGRVERVPELWEQAVSSRERNLGLTVRRHNPGFASY